MKKIIRLPSLSRVSPGSKATLQIPLGPTYERIVFSVAAAAGLDANDIGRIDVVMNGNVKMTFKDLQRLMDINAYYGREADTVSATAMQFAIHFNRAEMAENIWRAAPGVGTADLQTLHIEMDIPAAAPADMTITAHAQANPERQNLGVFFNVKEFPVSSATAGQFEADKLPRGAWYSAIHLFKADISAVEVVANDVKIIDATKTVLERFQRAAAPKARVPQTAKATHVDFTTDGVLLDCLPTANLDDFRVRMTLATAGNVDIVTETLDTLG